MSDVTLFTTVAICAFFGGLIDAAVGGGGLVQLPALLHALAHYNLATILATHKLAVWCGTFAAIFNSVKKIKINWKLILPTMLSAFMFAFLGAKCVVLVSKQLMNWIIFILLLSMAIYTFFKKDLGEQHRPHKGKAKHLLYGSVFGAVIGFYDGIFGPGSGSFLLFLFVKVFGFDFLNASVSAKIVNLGTFSAALLFFIPSGHVLWHIGLIIASGNILGSLTGSVLVLRYGSRLIRKLFLILMLCLILKMGYTLV